MSDWLQTALSIYFVCSIVYDWRERNKLRAEKDSLHEQLFRARSTLFELQQVHSGRSVTPSLPVDIVKRLLSLCHPDKHGNSKASTEVTQWLLEQR